MKNLSKDKREKIVLIVIAGLVVIAGTWYGVISQQNAKLEKNRKTIEEEQLKVENGKRLLNSTKQLREDLAGAAEALKKIESGMASGDMYSWIILKVNQFKRGYKVDIPQFSREVTGPVGMLPRFPYRAATFTVKGTGYFHDLGKFIADFENEFPYLRIQNVQMAPARSGSAADGTTVKPEEIAFRMELVALIHPLN